ncbi:MAG: hypothetical protein PHN80_04710 [Hespellia sp.]|nr:hypothetical protein [Hespellia sp.]
MKQSEMEKIFYDGIAPGEMCNPKKKEYWDTLKLYNVLEQEFRALLTPEQIQMLDDFKEYRGKMATLENEEHFVQGIALGIRMTSEAFVMGQCEVDT